MYCILNGNTDWNDSSMITKTAKVAAIHDLSGVGRCSLGVILPTMSVMGIQVCPVPTAVLSTHTGGFGDMALRDLSDYIIPALEHYKRLNYSFDCIYSGFLASKEQIDHCLEFLSSYPNALKVVDPVMGDCGKPYKTYTPEMCSRMSELVAAADIITPNPTEASMLLGEPMSFCSDDLSTQTAKSILARLAELGPEIVVVTSATVGGKCCNIGFEKKTSRFWKVPFAHVPAQYSGTGDIFAAVLTGSVLKGDSLPIAMNRATAFLELLIKTTYSYGTDQREGVMLEQCLGFLSSYQTLCAYEKL